MTASKTSSKTSSKSALSRITTHINATVDTTSHTLELCLLLLSIAIGMQDAIAAVDFHCFASNQTGNTILIIVGLVIPVDERPGFSLPLRDCGISLAMYVAGTFLSGQLANALDAVRLRWWLVLSSIVQTALVIIAAGVHQSEVGHLAGAPGNSLNLGSQNWAELGLLAFSSGMQSGMVRHLKITDITTANATSTWIDLMIDCKLFAGPTKNRPRNRRVGFLIALVAGVCVGAVLKRKVGSAITIGITAVMKVICCLLLFYMREEDDTASVYWVV